MVDETCCELWNDNVHGKSLSWYVYVRRYYVGFKKKYEATENKVKQKRTPLSSYNTIYETTFGEEVVYST